MTAAVLFFGVWSLASAFATGVASLTVLRFLTGIGLGVSMPNAATLMAEYAPPQLRALMVTIVFCGFTFGAAGGGFVSAWLICYFAGLLTVYLLGNWLTTLIRVRVCSLTDPTRAMRSTTKT